MRRISLVVAVIIICSSAIGILTYPRYVLGSSEEDHHFVGAVGGENEYNRGQAPEDWWGQIEQMHGHVGPWNVLGWRIGQAALREFDTKWGRHELDVICYVPIKTPYSCMADGLVIGTGNTIGRLDLRLAEVVSLDFIHVCIRRKDGTGPILIFRPKQTYLRHIDAPKPEELEKLSRECSNMAENDLFEVTRTMPSEAKK
ncbi:MAG: formylmethanofuran dehydrogenase subunit E family protein [Planctomycetes bacterium]|nr:formylmethanofuran dehydrogenase subunit E family protein [Planctomycetota bacterium]MBL7186750.1 formylmethanofuran dehydrogenase subunit E family protein [Phycisphaerae bacterium]